MEDLEMAEMAGEGQSDTSPRHKKPRVIMATTSTTPPPLQVLTAKEKKYDRQLRLWAAAGQKALEEAHILLINSGCGVVGVETLKNLILPGIGNFTIADNKKVDEEDLGVDFFLSEDSLGKSRAEESCRLLEELNPEVNGTAIQQTMRELLDNEASFDKYTLIIAVSPVQTSELQTLIDFAWGHEIPLFHISSVGFYSTFSLQLPPEFPIVDTHPDPASTQDLRLLNPWPELSDFTRVKTADLENFSDHEHGHIPYLLLLLHYLDEWRAAHDGKAPENYGEKSKFRDMVKQGTRRNNPEGGEENYDEAVAAVLKSLNPPELSSGLREVFESDECKDPDLESANFWIIAHAIRTFHTNHNVLPLPGALPDMKSQSNDYVQLQNIYKSKARKDLAEVATLVQSMEKHIGRSSAIDEKEIEAFCKGAAFVKLIRGNRMRSGDITAMNFGDCARYMIRELEDDQSLIPIYISMRIAEYFMDLFGRQGLESHKENIEQSEDVMEVYGKNNIRLAENVKQDMQKEGNGQVGDIDQTKDPDQGGDSDMKKVPPQMYLRSYSDHKFFSALEEYGHQYDAQAAKQRVSPVLHEIERANGSELHNISALTGGMVAQEAIKVITKQYVPINGTCVFDGIRSMAMVLKL